MNNKGYNNKNLNNNFNDDNYNITDEIINKNSHRSKTTNTIGKGEQNTPNKMKEENRKNRENTSKKVKEENRKSRGNRKKRRNRKKQREYLISEKCRLIRNEIETLNRRWASNFLSKLECSKANVETKMTCKNTIFFLLLYSCVLCLVSAIETYTEGMLDQLQRKYYFSYYSMSFFQNVRLLGFLCSLLFVLFFGNYCHKPICISLGVFISSLGSIVWSVPYFIDTNPNGSLQCTSATSLFYYYSEYCSNFNITGLSFNALFPAEGVCSPCLGDPVWLSQQQLRYAIFYIGGYGVGFGTGIFSVLGIVYLEEGGDNVSRKAPIYYGVIMSMAGLGQFLGSCLAWVFLAYNENLSANEELLDSTIRAWWIGMVIIFILLFISGWLFLFFPKWIVEPAWSANKRYRRLIKLDQVLNWLESQRQNSDKNYNEEHAQLGLSPVETNYFSINADVVRNVQHPPLANCISNITESTIVSKKSSDGWNNFVTQKSQTSSQSQVESDRNETIEQNQEYPDWHFKSEQIQMEIMNQAKSTPLININNNPNPNNPNTFSKLNQDLNETYGTIINQNSYDNSDLNQCGYNIHSPPFSNINKSSINKKNIHQNGSIQSGTTQNSLYQNGAHLNSYLQYHMKRGETNNLTSSKNLPKSIVTNGLFEIGIPFKSIMKSSNKNFKNYLTENNCEDKKKTEGVFKNKRTKKIGKRCLALIKLVSSPSFFLILLAVSLSAYLPGGYRKAINEFVEMQYQIQSVNAWFYTAGLSYSLALTIGPCLGGLLIYKFSLEKKQLIYMILVLLVVNVVLFLFIFPVNCSNANSYNSNSYNSASLQNAICFENCGCDLAQRQAVCTDKNVYFPSICQATCSLQSQCQCTNLSVLPSNCSSNCPIYGLYWILLFFAILAHSMGYVNVIILFLRIGKSEDKNMSLSLAFWLIVLIAFVPGQAVFSGIQNSSCTEFKPNCNNENRCWSYDLNRNRYILHGTNIVFQIASMILFSILLLLAKKGRIKFVLTEEEEGHTYPIYANASAFRNRYLRTISHTNNNLNNTNSINQANNYMNRELVYNNVPIPRKMSIEVEKTKLHYKQEENVKKRDKNQNNQHIENFERKDSKMNESFSESSHKTNSQIVLVQKQNRKNKQKNFLTSGSVKFPTIYNKEEFNLFSISKRMNNNSGSLSSLNKIRVPQENVSSRQLVEQYLNSNALPNLELFRRLSDKEKQESANQNKEENYEKDDFSNLTFESKRNNNEQVEKEPSLNEIRF